MSKSNIAAIKNASSISDVANILDYESSRLAYRLYKEDPKKRYERFQIPKKHGGFREICAPNKQLKCLQSKLADFLQDCIEEADGQRKKILQSSKILREDKVVHGFKRKRSIVTNAHQHRRKRYVFNIDLADFFGSINFGRVRGFLIKDKIFSLDPKVATIIAQIATFDNNLPQGSPSSPVLSNLIAKPLDLRLSKLAKKYKCTYTRYADDITFSTNLKTFPKEIAYQDPATLNQWLPGTTLDGVIGKCGFKINPSKTRMRCRKLRQEVTGLVVNEHVNVNSDYRKLVRAMAYQYFKTGEYYEKFRIIDSSGKIVEEKKSGNPVALIGRVCFVDYIKRHSDGKLARDVGQPKNKIHIDEYKRLLLFHDFYQAKRPIIIFEGKTDNIYLSCAIHSLAAEFPMLVEKEPSGQVSLSVRFHKYESHKSGAIGLLGGDAPLKTFIIEIYKNFVDRYTSQDPKNPIICIYDNDDGANGIVSYVKQHHRKTDLREVGFVNVYLNLYVVLLPRIHCDKDLQIEDYFGPLVLEAEVEGKKFVRKQKKNSSDKEAGYGKVIFAYKVVKPNANNISFLKFKPLLNIICEIIKHNAKKIHQ